VRLKVVARLRDIMLNITSCRRLVQHSKQISLLNRWLSQGSTDLRSISGIPHDVSWFSRPYSAECQLASCHQYGIPHVGRNRRDTRGPMARLLVIAQIVLVLLMLVGISGAGDVELIFFQTLSCETCTIQCTHSCQRENKLHRIQVWSILI
jgi:hypothetical protein